MDRVRTSAHALALGALASAAAHGAPRRPVPERPAAGFAATVRGVAQALAASDRRVDARTIALTPRRSGDDLLRLVPGLLVSRHGAEGKGTQIFLRGIDAAHGSDVEVLCDGLPVNELSNVHGQGYLDLGFLIPEAVRQIEVRKGSFDAAQGPFATAGSARFELGLEQRGLRVAYEAGSTARQRLLFTYGPRAQPADVFVAAEAMHDGGYGHNRQSERLALLGKARIVSRGERLRLSALVGAYGARFGGPSPLPLADYLEGRAGFYDSYSRDTGGASARVLSALQLDARGRAGRLAGTAFVQWRRLSLRENFTGFLLYPERGDRRLQFHEALGGGLRLGHTLRLLPRLHLHGGLGLFVERIGQFEDQIEPVGDAPAERSWQRNRDLGALQLLGAAHLSLSWRPLPWLWLHAGARLDVMHFDATERTPEGAAGSATFVQPSPRLALVLPLPRGVQLFASYGRGLRPPEARSVLTGQGVIETKEISEYQGRAPGLTASDSSELGLRAALPRRVTLGVAGFATVIGNEILFDHVAAVNVALNSARRLGVELSVEAEPLRWLRLRLDATCVDARFIDSGAPVPGAPRFLTTLAAQIEHPWGLRAGLRLFGLAPRPLRYDAIAGGAALVDLLLGWRFQRVQVDLQIDNLLDYRYREGEFQYASWFHPGRPPSALPALHFSAAPPITARGQLTVWL